MNGTSAYTHYNFDYTISTASTYAEGAFQLTSDAGVTDDFALAVGQALQAHTWPVGTTFKLNLTKDAYSVPQYQADFTASPPAFT